MIRLERAYDLDDNDRTKRFLVERLWPRGIKKTELHLEAWLKEVAPSTELRKWFNHDPDKWQEFRHRYFAELKENPEAWKPLITAAKHGSISLVYSSRDTEHNNAVALAEFLKKHL